MIDLSKTRLQSALALYLNSPRAIPLPAQDSRLSNRFKFIFWAAAEDDMSALLIRSLSDCLSIPELAPTTITVWPCKLSALKHCVISFQWTVVHNFNVHCVRNILTWSRKWIFLDGSFEIRSLPSAKTLLLSYRKRFQRALHKEFAVDRLLGDEGSQLPSISREFLKPPQLIGTNLSSARVITTCLACSLLTNTETP